MSHIVTIQTQVRDPGALAAACRRLSLAEPKQETATINTASRLPPRHNFARRRET